MYKKPSVSELKQMLNNPNLMNWANKVGLEGKTINEARGKKAIEGTKRHKDIQIFLNKGIRLTDKIRQEKLDLFLKDKIIMAVEEYFENEHYTGRIDLLFKHNEVLYAADFKPKFKRTYLENMIQLHCYKMHYGADKICIIDTENFCIFEQSIESEKVYNELIFNLINIYKLKQSL